MIPKHLFKWIFIFNGFSMMMKKKKKKNKEKIFLIFIVVQYPIYCGYLCSTSIFGLLNWYNKKTKTKSKSFVARNESLQSSFLLFKNNHQLKCKWNGKFFNFFFFFFFWWSHAQYDRNKLNLSELMIVSKHANFRF